MSDVEENENVSRRRSKRTPSKDDREILTKDVVVALLVGFVLGVVVETVARASAQADFGKAGGFDRALSSTLRWGPGLFPVLIAAVAGARGVHRHGFRALPIVLALTLAPHAYWTYEGESVHLAGLAEHHSTMSLGPFFIWIFSIVSVLLATPLALFVCRRAFRRV